MKEEEAQILIVGIYVWEYFITNSRIQFVSVITNLYTHLSIWSHHILFSPVLFLFLRYANFKRRWVFFFEKWTSFTFWKIIEMCTLCSYTPNIGKYGKRRGNHSISDCMKNYHLPCSWCSSYFCEITWITYDKMWENRIHSAVWTRVIDFAKETERFQSLEDSLYWIPQKNNYKFIWRKISLWLGTMEITLVYFPVFQSTIHIFNNTT